MTLAGGATLLHEHLSLGADFGERFRAACRASLKEAEGAGLFEERPDVRRQRERRQALADALDEGIVAADEEGHVRTQ